MTQVNMNNIMRLI